MLRAYDKEGREIPFALEETDYVLDDGKPNINEPIVKSSVDCQVLKKNADISEIIRQAKLKAAHKYLGDYSQTYIWAGDIEKFTKEFEENIARELKSIFSL